VSVGQIHTYLTRWEWDVCAGQPAAQPNEQAQEPARAVHPGLGSGELTGMITGG
jgi:hypothetical protein